MNVEVTSRNGRLTDATRDYAERKLNRLDRYLPHITQVRLELAQETLRTGDRTIAQLTVRHDSGAVLRAEVKDGADLFAAVDAAIDKIYRQIERYKGKLRRRGGDVSADAEDSPIDTPEEDDDTLVVKRKKIEMAPMSEEEAIEQMELLGHTFFVFFNVETTAINVVYRREKTGYGLIQPLFG